VAVSSDDTAERGRFLKTYAVRREGLDRTQRKGRGAEGRKTPGGVAPCHESRKKALGPNGTGQGRNRQNKKKERGPLQEGGASHWKKL